MSPLFLALVLKKLIQLISVESLEMLEFEAKLPKSVSQNNPLVWIVLDAGEESGCP